MKLTDSELQIMELFWNAQKPLTSADILEISPREKGWKDNSIYIMIQTLQRKEAIREIGAIKGEKGKYLRLFEPTLSRRDYAAQSLTGTVDKKELPLLFSALIEQADLSREDIAALEAMLSRKKMGMK